MNLQVWQNALLDSPASENELLSWAHQQYGDRAPSSAAKSDIEYDASNDGGSNHSFDGLDPVPRQRLYSNIQDRGLYHISNLHSNVKLRTILGNVYIRVGFISVCFVSAHELNHCMIKLKFSGYFL